LTPDKLREKFENEPGPYTEAAIGFSELSIKLEGAVRETFVDSNFR